MTILQVLLAALSLTSPTDPTVDLAPKTVQVFVMAGQSNMEGKAPNALYEHQANDEKTAALFAPWRKDGKWIERDDVFIKYLGRKGRLTIGYGSRGRTGVELEFGRVVGDHYEEPVLLIKTAWGGHSLIKNFRPPSSGLPSDERLAAELEQSRKRVRQRNQKRKRNDELPTMDDIKSAYGQSYRNMMAEVKNTMKNAGTLFPELRGRMPKLAGFVWFQGWNDQYGGAEKEYALHMENLIRDVRKELNAPNLPVVIGVMGQNGSKPAKGAMLAIQKAQMGMEKVKGFAGNVKAVRTDVLIDKAAEKLYPEWRNRFEEWKVTGGDFAFHYLGSAIWFNRMGEAFGKAMIEMLK